MPTMQTTLLAVILVLAYSLFDSAAGLLCILAYLTWNLCSVTFSYFYC